jgi:hypothetical protein
MGPQHILKQLLVYGLIVWTGLVLSVQVYAFPDTSVLETFTGTDDTSPPNSNWTNAALRGAAAGLDIEDNAVAPSTTGGYWGGYWNVEPFGPTSEAYATIANIGSTGFFAVCVRLANIGVGTTDGYCVETADGTDDFIIYRLDDTVPTQLAQYTPSVAVTVDDKFGIKAVGSNICAWFNDDAGGWTELGCVTDSTHSAAGHIGLYINGTETVGGMDDFGGGTVGGLSQMRRRLER